MEDGRLDALVLKLRHPLAKIRARALQNLLFKLRERLVRWSELEPLQDTLTPSLLACLESSLELSALHVLQLLVQIGSESFAVSLRRFGAAQKLQRAANNNSELRATYEKLLSQIYVSQVMEEEHMAPIITLAEEQEVVEQLTVSREKLDRRRGFKVAELERTGWRFAHVTLSSVDEQFLFEFEVKLQLRTETQDLVAACATFRNVLLRNFPAEVFLQRPAVLQFLLHLVQQPILPGSPATGEQSDGRDCLMERAMEVSMGVNYFDEMMNATFSTKRGNLSGAVVMASLKAIESFLYALRITQKTCLDPTYVVHAPSVHVQLYDSYDSRRGRYPRASVEAVDGVDRSSEQRGGESATRPDQFSLSGAVYRIFTSLLPLLRSANHPRLHLLNLLLAALPDLAEKGCPPSVETNLQDLDKLRLEKILEILSSICRPVPSEQVRKNLIDCDLELTHSVTWKIVELVLRLLRLRPSSFYRVESVSNTAGEPTPEGEGNIIIVPRLLWEAVKLWVASPAFTEVAANEWKDESLVQCLSKIDGTISAFVNLKHSSQQDAKMILDFVGLAKIHHEELTKFTPWEKPATMNLAVAQKAIHMRYTFDDADAEIVADATLQVIWTVLTANGKDEAGVLDEDATEIIQVILCDLLSDLGEKKTSASRNSIVVHFFRGLMGFVDELDNGVFTGCRRQLVTKVICEPTFLTLMLLTLARLNDGSDDPLNSAVLWRMLRLALNELAGTSRDQLALLEPVVPLLQHFAYIEPSEGSSTEQRSVQPQLAEVLNQVERVLPDHTRQILICRCLLHQSSYIRKSAASGILRLLSRMNPSSVEWISKSKEICEDPFGGASASDDKAMSFDMKLMETPLPVTRTSEYQPSDNELSSQLSRLAHLHKVVTSTSSAFESMKEAALRELVMFIDNASTELFTLFEELGKMTDLMDLFRAILQSEARQKDWSMVLQSLLLFRTLLLRSQLLRKAIQHDNDIVKLLMPLIFHSEASIRAQMYYILLLLTCSADNFIPGGVAIESSIYENPRTGADARIPEMIKSTFGLHSSRWARCCVVTCSLKEQLQASYPRFTKQVDASWVQEVKAVITQTPFSLGGDKEERNDESSNEFASRLATEYSIIVQKLRDAPSHGKCLNAVYHLMTICTAWNLVRERFVGEWEADFERYFAVPPKSERDEVIIGSLVSTLSVMFCAMTRGEQLRALVVLKRKVLPLLKRSQNKAFSLQVARLLLNVSKSKVGDLFLSLAADTDIIATICTKYSSIYATEPVLQAMMLDILLRFARGMNENTDIRLSTTSREKICKRLVEMLSPLLTVVCSHRVPGSFLDRDAFVVGSQCMIAIMRTLPREVLLASDSPLQHTDSSILLDSSWASRFLFDHVSPTRELGYLVIQNAASTDPPSSRLLGMAFETSTDDTESDAVRAAACNVLTKKILQYDELASDQQATMVEVFHGPTFARKALSGLSATLKDPKLFARSASAFVRLVRVLYVQSETLAPHFGDMRTELEVAQEEYDIYPLLVQALSLREWKKKCDKYCSRYLLLPHCAGDAWRQSLLPAILDLMGEVLNLVQGICRYACFEQVAFFLKHTTLQYQLMELVGDVHASLTSLDSMVSKTTSQSHYEVLDLCAGTLSVLLVQIFDQHRESYLEHFGVHSNSGVGVDFVDVVAKLLASHHPINFRVSFSRVVPAVSLLIPASLHSSDTSIASALCCTLFDLYQEVTEFRPLDASTSLPGGQGRVFPLASIRRVSCAVQVLLETNSTLQQLIHVKRGLPFALTSIKESFSTIRVTGGFGGKRSRSSNTASSQDAYVLDLCGRIQTHMDVVGAIVGGNIDSQRRAKDERLLGIILSNWSVMKMAHVRGSQLLLRTLHLLANYIYGNDSARSSLLISLTPGSGKFSGGDGAQSLLSLLFILASSRGDVSPSRREVANGAASATDFALSNAACQVLKAALLNTECVLGAVKTGSISKLIDSLQDRLKQTRQTSKTSHLEYENLALVLGVLGSIACSEEGARVLYTSWATVLSLVFDDAMHSSNDAVRSSVCLFMRDLALSKATKNNFAMWEELLDGVVETCVQVSNSDRGELTTLEYLSAVLWSLVYNNQKARALLLSKPAALRSLQQVLASQTSGAGASQQTLEFQASSQEIVENLRRVLLLVQE